MSSSYTIWCDLMVIALTWYSLADHILSNNTFTDDLMWTKLDAIVLCWLTNMITTHLQEAIRARGHPACHLWLTLEIQFLGNRETCTLLLDAAFHNFVQGDLSMIEYCHKFKGMADALGNLGLPIDNRILVLNILCGLNQRFKHLGPSSSAPRRSQTFLKFMMTSFQRRSTWILLGHPLLLWHSTPALHLWLLSLNVLHRSDRPTATTTAALVAMVARTTAVVVSLATPSRPPLDQPTPFSMNAPSMWILIFILSERRLPSVKFASSMSRRHHSSLTSSHRDSPPWCLMSFGPVSISTVTEL
jgi:hypothetical protein